MEKLYGKQLEIMATKARLLGLDAVHTAASGHIGGSLSAMDILTTLYFNVMQVDPANPQDPDRDRFVLSKGHCTPALYPVLSLRGFFPQEDLKLFRSIKGHYSGHPDMRHVKGVDMSTGSLGQGISAAVGMALAGKLAKKDYRVYALLGDGEIAEGQVWEAAMSAGSYGLDNIIGIVDVNGIQADGKTSTVLNTEPLHEKFAAFNYDVQRVNGNSITQVMEAVDKARFSTEKKPHIILCDTVPGTGLSFLIGNPKAHFISLSDEDWTRAFNELERGKD